MPEPDARLEANSNSSVPAMKQTPESGNSSDMPMISSSGLPIAMVNAKPRNAMPRIAPRVSAEWALSMGSKKTFCKSPAMLARREAPTPAVKSAMMLTRNSRPLLYPAWRSTPAVGAVVDMTTQEYRNPAAAGGRDRIAVLTRCLRTALLLAPALAGCASRQVYFNDFNGPAGTTYPEWTSSGYTNTA